MIVNVSGTTSFQKESADSRWLMANGYLPSAIGYF
jgi:hypothetical protein